MKIKLKEIIGQFLNSADQSSHEFLRLWNMGVWGMKTEFNLDITGVMKTVLLPVNANKTVDLPCDYISYSKIGVLNAKGEVVTYKRNDQLAKINKNKPSRLDGAPTDGSFYDSYLNNPYYNYYYFNYTTSGSSYHLYGLDSGTVTLGTYTVDDSAKIVYLGIENSYETQIVLEYLSDGYSENMDDYEIDVQAAEAMLCYLRWNDSKDSKKYGSGEVQMNMKAYYNQKRLAKMRINKFVLNEMNDISRRYIKLTAKS
jgi:hypothetical protein